MSECALLPLRRALWTVFRVGFFVFFLQVTRKLELFIYKKEPFSIIHYIHIWERTIFQYIYRKREISYDQWKMSSYGCIDIELYEWYWPEKGRDHIEQKNNRKSQYSRSLQQFDWNSKLEMKGYGRKKKKRLVHVEQHKMHTANHSNSLVASGLVNSCLLRVSLTAPWTLKK